MSLTPFGNALRDFRIERGLLLWNMAHGLGLGPARLSEIETGRLATSARAFELIVNRLNDVYHLGEWREVFIKAFHEGEYKGLETVLGKEMQKVGKFLEMHRAANDHIIAQMAEATVELAHFEGGE